MQEYEYRMKAYRLKSIDKEYDMYLSAWVNHQVTATKEQGKKTVSVYKDFKSFYDYESRLKEVEKPKGSRLSQDQKRMAQMAAKVNMGRR